MKIPFTEEEMNVGKVLLLRFNHKLKIKELKTILRAKSVKEIQSDVDPFQKYLNSLFFQSTPFGHPSNQYDTRNYFVVGDQAQSTFLAMKNVGYVASFTIDKFTLVDLHNATICAESIRRTRKCFAEIFSNHSNFFQLDDPITMQKKYKILYKSTNLLQNLRDTYGLDEFNANAAIIQNLMKSTW